MQKAMANSHWEEAILAAEQWEALEKKDWLIILNQAVCISRHQEKHPAQAAALAKEALKLSRMHVTAVLGCAEIANNTGKHEWCLELIETIGELRRSGDFWRVVELKATALARIGRFDAAMQELEAWPQNNRNWRWHLAKGDAYTQFNEWEGAREHYLEILKERPNDQLANQNLALVLLAQKNWREGWEQYEWRHSNPRRQNNSPPTPLPSRENIHNKTVIVIGEQGIGDQIMTARYLEILAKEVKHLIYQPAPRLMNLMKRSLPENVEIRHAQEPIVTTEGEVVIVGSGSLPLLCWEDQHFGTEYEERYLRADPERVKEWKQRLSEINAGKPCIGLGWLGGCNGADHRERGLERIDISRLTANREIAWIDLQHLPEGWKDIRKSYAVGCQDLMKNPGQNLDETAALIEALDGVITTRQTVAHLAGALGVHGSVLVPERREWRYTQSGSTWDWYVTMSLSHQCRRGDWEWAIKRAMDALDL